jgi:hypothetical protein
MAGVRGADRIDRATARGRCLLDHRARHRLHDDGGGLPAGAAGGRQGRVVGAAHCGLARPRGSAGRCARGALVARWPHAGVRRGSRARMAGALHRPGGLRGRRRSARRVRGHAIRLPPRASVRCREGKWLADLQALARAACALGIHAIHGNDGSPSWCTVANPSRFFSHRRDRVSGRFAASRLAELKRPLPARLRACGRDCRAPIVPSGTSGVRPAQSIHHKGDDGAEHGAGGVGGFGDGHHQHDVEPADRRSGTRWPSRRNVAVQHGWCEYFGITRITTQKQETRMHSDPTGPPHAALPAAWATAGQGAAAFGSIGGAPRRQAFHAAVVLRAREAQALQQAYVREAAELWNQGLAGVAAGDKRFAGEAWGSNPVAAFSAAVYLLNGAHLLGLAERPMPTPRPRPACASRSNSGWPPRRPATSWRSTPKRRRRPSRPAARASPRACRTCWHDLQQGHVSMTDESAFEVGRNVATTEGAVVFENELFQLIEYKPPLPRCTSGPTSWCRPASTSSTSSTCSRRTR